MEVGMGEWRERQWEGGREGWMKEGRKEGRTKTE